jgi:hypothetical protein
MEQFFEELYFFRFVCKDFYQVKMEIDFPLCLQLRKNSIRKTAGKINGTTVGVFGLRFSK